MIEQEQIITESGQVLGTVWVVHCSQCRDRKRFLSLKDNIETITGALDVALSEGWAERKNGRLMDILCPTCSGWEAQQGEEDLLEGTEGVVAEVGAQAAGCGDQ